MDSLQINTHSHSTNSPNDYENAIDDASFTVIQEIESMSLEDINRYDDPIGVYLDGFSDNLRVLDALICKMAGFLQGENPKAYTPVLDSILTFLVKDPPGNAIKSIKDLIGTSAIHLMNTGDNETKGVLVDIVTFNDKKPFYMDYTTNNFIVDFYNLPNGEKASLLANVEKYFRERPSSFAPDFLLSKFKKSANFFKDFVNQYRDIRLYPNEHKV